jgi:hypothetical protein
MFNEKKLLEKGFVKTEDNKGNATFILSNDFSKELIVFLGDNKFITKKSEYRGGKKASYSYNKIENGKVVKKLSYHRFCDENGESKIVVFRKIENNGALRQSISFYEEKEPTTISNTLNYYDESPKIKTSVNVQVQPPVLE